MIREQTSIGTLLLVALLLAVPFSATIPFAGSVAAAAGNGPAVGIDAPADGSELQSQPVISGRATDEDGTVTSVEVQIQRSSDDKYFDGSDWVTAETWLSAQGTTEWSFDTYDSGNGIVTDGTYTVTARATDDDGQTQTEPFEEIGADPVQVTYTVDTQSPSLSSVTVTEAAGDDTVEPGDTVLVSADLSDHTSGIGSVVADTSVLGGPERLSLTHDSGTTYSDTFTVATPNMGDGVASIAVTATDEFGQTRTSSDEISLDTTVDSAESVTLHSEFAGIVEDDGSVRVTARGLTDAQGFQVDDDTAELNIQGQTFSLSVTDGTVDEQIDPTRISDTAGTGTTTGDLAGATDSITLVHEAKGLDAGYQALGTPMPASDVLVEDVADVATYDTDTGSWDQPRERRAGEGYYLNAESDDARIGYIFEDTAEMASNSRLLDQGYNLVGASPNMNEAESTDVTADLGADIQTSDAAIEVRLPTSQQPSDQKGLESFTEPASATDDVGAFEGYWVYVETSENYIRTTVEVGYDPNEQS